MLMQLESDCRQLSADLMTSAWFDSWVR